MNLSLESIFMTAREFRRRITKLTLHVASRGAVYTRDALELAWSARNPHANKFQARNRETLAVARVAAEGQLHWLFFPFGRTSIWRSFAPPLAAFHNRLE
jgi:hypothetical protein